MVEIDSLDNSEGCFASNEYFAKFFQLSKRRVIDIINNLEKKGFINKQIVYKKDSKEVEKRIITLVRGSEENCTRGSEENCTDNNTSSNNTINILDDDDTYARELAEIENEFKKYYSKKITPIIRKTLKELFELANKDLLLYSIGKLQDVDKPIAYLKAIIKNYLQNDIQTVAQAKVFDDKYKGKSKRKSKDKMDNIVPSSGVTVPNHFYYDWMNDLEDEKEKEKDYQSQADSL